MTTAHCIVLDIIYSTILLQIVSGFCKRSEKSQHWLFWLGS